MHPLFFFPNINYKLDSQHKYRVSSIGCNSGIVGYRRDYGIDRALKYTEPPCMTLPQSAGMTPPSCLFQVSKSLTRIENVSSFTEFVKAFSQFGNEMVELAHLSGDRQNVSGGGVTGVGGGGGGGGGEWGGDWMGVGV